MGGNRNHHVTALVAAGGSGQRLGVLGGKQLLELSGRPIVAWTVQALADSESIQDIVVVCDPDRVAEYAAMVSESVQTDKSLYFVAGGDTRAESVMSGLAEILGLPSDIVVVHDGARPLVQKDLVDEAVKMLIDGSGQDEGRRALSGVVVGYPSIDTIKIVDPTNGQVRSTPDRSLYWMAQTPQVFWVKELAGAYARAQEHCFTGTDDSSYIEFTGGNVRMLEGSRNNIKITVSEDMGFAEGVLDMVSRSDIDLSRTRDYRSDAK